MTLRPFSIHLRSFAPLPSMTSGRGALLYPSPPYGLHRFGALANSLHVFPNVTLRRCETQPLERLKVTVLHTGAKAMVIANLLSARGDQVTHFIKDNSQPPCLEDASVYADLERAEIRGSSTILPYSSGSELLASLKSADVFVDSSKTGIGMAPCDVVKINAGLIYALVQGTDPTPFSSVRTLERITGALFGREKTRLGQVIRLADSSEAACRIDAQLRQASAH